MIINIQGTFNKKNLSVNINLFCKFKRFKTAGGFTKYCLSTKLVRKLTIIVYG